MRTFRGFIYEAVADKRISEIEKALNSISSKIIDKKLSPLKIIDIIQKPLLKKYGAFTSFNTNRVVDPTSTIITGLYDINDDEQGDPPIELIFSFNPKDDVLQISREGWLDLVNRTTGVLSHELLHQDQARLRDFEIQRDTTKVTAKTINLMKQQKYLGNPDEIEAFGHSIAFELLSKMDKKEAINALRSFKKNSLKKSVELNGYLKAYNFDAKHPVIKRLIKKTVQFVEILGKK